MLNIYPPVCTILPLLQANLEIASGIMGWSAQSSFENSGGLHPYLRINMLHGLSKSSGEITDGLVLSLENGLQ